jgi:hypothetical protein
MAPLFLLSLLQWIVVIGLILGSSMILVKYYFSFQKTSEEPPVIHDSEEKKILLPLRLQACERIILFLERISPANVVMRLNRTELTASQLQAEILKTIREEFEYNLSQQLYISSKAWEMVKNAKEEVIKTVNLASGMVDPNGTSTELIKSIIEQSLQTGKIPVDAAIEEVKKEIQRLF